MFIQFVSSMDSGHISSFLIESPDKFIIDVWISCTFRIHSQIVVKWSIAQSRNTSHKVRSPRKRKQKLFGSITVLHNRRNIIWRTCQKSRSISSFHIRIGIITKHIIFGSVIHKIDILIALIYKISVFACGFIKTCSQIVIIFPIGL